MDVDPEIAAAMGFSSFGTQPSNKKRKYDHNDAVVDVAIGSASKQQSTGANSLQLGARQKKPSQPGPYEHGTGHSSTLVACISTDVGNLVAQSSRLEGKQEHQEPNSLSQFLARGQTTTSGASPSLPSSNSSLAALAVAALQPLNPHTTVFPSPVKSLKDDFQALRQGVKNEYGDVAYFLPSFVEYPWRDLPSKNT